MNEYLTHGSVLRSKSGELFVLLRISVGYFSLYSMSNWLVQSTVKCNSDEKTILKKTVPKARELQHISVKPDLIPLREYLPVEMTQDYFKVGSLYQVILKSEATYHCIVIQLYIDSKKIISFFDIHNWNFIIKTSNNYVHSKELKNCMFKLLVSHFEVKRIRIAS